MARRKINEDIRQKVIKAHKSGKSMRTIAKEFGVGLASVHRIVKEKALQKGPKKSATKKVDAERQKRIQVIEKRIAELEEKIAILESKKK